MEKNKIPLVLIPGLLSNELIWGHQINHLDDIAKIQIISAAQDNSQKMVQSILEKAPSKFALAGHSMGGWLCLELIRLAPSRISKLCLLNTTAKTDSNEKKSKREKMMHQSKKKQFESILDELVEYFVFNPLVKSKVQKMFLEVGKEVFLNQEKAMIARKECQSVLANINCPTLVIHAMKDKIFSLEDSKELVERIPGAKMAIVEDSGHMSPIEVPQAITAFLRFWLIYF